MSGIGEVVFWIIIALAAWGVITLLSSGGACVSEYTRDRINGLKY
jgi:hypothetical protein